MTARRGGEPPAPIPGRDVDGNPLPPEPERPGGPAPAPTWGGEGGGGDYAGGPITGGEGPKDVKRP